MVIQLLGDPEAMLMELYLIIQAGKKTEKQFSFYLKEHGSNFCSQEKICAQFFNIHKKKSLLKMEL